MPKTKALTYNLKAMREVSNSTAAATLRLLKKLGHPPVQELVHNSRVYRVWDQAAYDALVAYKAKRKQEAEDVRAQLEAKKAAIAAPGAQGVMQYDRSTFTAADRELMQDIHRMLMWLTSQLGEVPKFDGEAAAETH